MFSIRPSSWSLTARLLLTATVPVLLMFTALTASLYLSGKSEVATIVQANGQLLARTLAQTSPFSIVSGNTAALERSVDRLLQSQTDIAAIEILDERHQPIVSRGSQTNHKTNQSTYLFEQTIAADVPNVDLFDGNTPHATNPGSSQAPKFRTGRTVGYVRVTLSPNSILAEQRRRLYANAWVTAIAFAISLFMAFYLAQRIQKPLNQVMRALRDIRSGQFHITFDSKINKANSTNGEIAELQATVIAMAQGLAVKREELESQVQTRTEDLREAVERAQASDNERRRLLAHSIDVIEEERKRIAMDMHDEFNASLIGIRMQAEAMLPHPGALLDPNEVESRVKVIITAVTQLYANTRRLVKRLRPEMLDILGLEGAIEGVVQTFNRDQHACYLALHVEPNLPKVPDKTAIAAYRVVQEALSNILKHSGATEGSVHMGLDAESGQIEIQIMDNGKGFDSNVKLNGFGLLGMRERIESVGGKFKVLSGVSLGTCIDMHLPASSQSKEIDHA